ncbi:MAG: sensor histidine kinase [Saprospiraceae bacterium]
MPSQTQHEQPEKYPPPLGWREQAVFALLGFLMSLDYYLADSVSWQIGLVRSLCDTASVLCILYLNYYWLIPRFFVHRRFAMYALACTGCTAGYVVLQRWSGLEMFLCESEGWHGVFSTVLDWALYLLLSTLFWYFRQFQTDRERQFLLRSENLEAELRFLRAQISPHFIFNSLNNIYTLALQRHENAAPMVARLADILRYALYDGNAVKTPLAQEIRAIEQFVDLQRLRNLPSANVDFYVEGSPQGWAIAPMLLLSFVENCFKHGQLNQDDMAWVRLEMEIEPSGAFRFSAENSLPPQGPIHEAGKGGGIGLKNARRQLELNYPGRHTLRTTADNGVFGVQLSLQLESAI